MQIPLFYEDINDAVRACVQALGGAKTVGATLWPSKQPHKAGEHLLNSLNPHHAQKLSLDETVMIFKMARDIGFHDGMNYLADHCGYRAPDPITPEDQVNELQRDFIEAVKVTQQLAKQIGALS